MYNLLLSPVAVFIIVFAAAVLLSALFSRLAFKNKAAAAGMKKPYACGENVSRAKAHPDYSQFFPFAFYFTILHVVALMVASVPIATIGTTLIAVIYISGAIVGLLVLYRR